MQTDRIFLLGSIAAFIAACCTHGSQSSTLEIWGWILLALFIIT
jgi:hypothetical protein